MDLVVGEEQAECGGFRRVFGDDEDALVADQAVDVRLAAHRLDEIDGGVDGAVVGDDGGVALAACPPVKVPMIYRTGRRAGSGTRARLQDLTNSVPWIPASTRGELLTGQASRTFTLQGSNDRLGTSIEPTAGERASYDKQPAPRYLKSGHAG